MGPLDNEIATFNEAATALETSERERAATAAELELSNTRAVTALATAARAAVSFNDAIDQLIAAAQRERLTIVGAE